MAKPEPHVACAAGLPTGMSSQRIVLILALLLGLQPVTTDLYLPALPAITEGFGAGMGQAQLTLTALLLAFGLSQLVWGPLSDRFGRRPILLWGMAAYTLASIASALAPSMGWLIAGRTLQGMAMGAGVMGARAVVRDLFAPVQGANVMSQALTGLGIIACACAPLGGLLTDALGWRMAAHHASPAMPTDVHGLALPPLQPRQPIKDQLCQPDHSPAPVGKQARDTAGIDFLMRDIQRCHLT